MTVSDLTTALEPATVRRTVLPNGLTILTEKMEHLRSVADGQRN